VAKSTTRKEKSLEPLANMVLCASNAKHVTAPLWPANVWTSLNTPLLSKEYNKTFLSQPPVATHLPLGDIAADSVDEVCPINFSCNAKMVSVCKITGKFATTAESTKAVSPGLTVLDCLAAGCFVWATKWFNDAPAAHNNALAINGLLRKKIEIIFIGLEYGFSYQN
jgi:hypothetical protein